MWQIGGVERVEDCAGEREEVFESKGEGLFEFGDD